jgi:cytochrome c553
MTPEDYLTITRSDVTNEKSEGGQVRSGGEAIAIRLCARCHGFGSVPPATSRIPVIAAQSPEYAKPTSATREQILRGQTIAAAGLAGEGVPACLVCHAGATSTFPTLAGQHSAYTANQLRLWQRGLRQSTAHGAIMAPIARRLNEQQIDDVAAFFHSLGTPARGGETETGTGAAP